MTVFTPDRAAGVLPGPPKPPTAAAALTAYLKPHGYPTQLSVSQLLGVGQSDWSRWCRGLNAAGETTIDVWLRTVGDKVHEVEMVRNARTGCRVLPTAAPVQP